MKVEGVLKDILESIKKPVSVGIDIGATSVKLIALKRVGHAEYQIVSYHSEPIEEGVISANEVNDPEKLSAIIRKAYKNSGASNKRVVITTAGGPVTTKKISAPKMSEIGLEKIIGQLVQSQHGIDVSNSYLDFYILKEDPDRPGNNIVVVAIADKGYIDTYKKIVADAGLELVAVEPACFAAERAFRAVMTGKFTANSGRKKPPKSSSAAAEKNSAPPKHAAIINVGAEYTSITLITEGKIGYTCDIEIGGKTLTAYIQQQNSVSLKRAEFLKIFTSGHVDAQSLNNFYGDLTSAVGRIIDNYSMEAPGFQVDRIYISGGGIMIKGAQERLSEDFGIPVEFISAADAVSFPKSFLSRLAQKEMKEVRGAAHSTPRPNSELLAELSEKISEKIKADGPKMVLAFGAALRDHKLGLEGVRVSLVPYREAARKKMIYEGLFYTAVCAITAAVIVVPFYVNASIELSHLQSSSKALKSRLDALQAEAAKGPALEDAKKKLQDRLAVIDSLQDSRYDTYKMLTNLVWSIPEGVSLFTVKADEKEVILSGSATDERSVAELMRSQSESGLFEKAELKVLKEAKSSNIVYHNFVVVLKRPPLPIGGGNE